MFPIIASKEICDLANGVQYSPIFLDWLCILQTKIGIVLSKKHIVNHWRFQGGARDACPPSQSNFFRFHTVFNKNLANSVVEALALSGKSWIRHC